MSENCRFANYKSGKVMEIPIMNRHFFSSYVGSQPGAQLGPKDDLIVKLKIMKKQSNC